MPYCQGKQKAEVQHEIGESLPALWPIERLHEGFWSVQDLLQRTRAQGGYPWGEEGELVVTGRMNRL